MQNVMTSYTGSVLLNVLDINTNMLTNINTTEYKAAIFKHIYSIISPYLFQFAFHIV